MNKMRQPKAEPETPVAEKKVKKEKKILGHLVCNVVLYLYYLYGFYGMLLLILVQVNHYGMILQFIFFHLLGI